MHVASSLLAGAAALLIGAGTASAATAVASNDLNVRSGPGTQYPVVTVIPQGGAVTATDCNGSWCRVDYRGRDGWASQAYLSGAVATGAPSYGYAEPEYDTGYPAYAYDYSEPYYGGAYYGAPLTFGLGYGWNHNRGAWHHNRGANRNPAWNHNRGANAGAGWTHNRGANAGAGWTHNRGANAGAGWTHNRAANAGAGWTHNRSANAGAGWAHNRGANAGISAGPSRQAQAGARAGGFGGGHFGHGGGHVRR